MICISIVILISVSIDSMDSVVIPKDWCPYVKPNGTYKGLGIYPRFRTTDVKEIDFVMFNRAGDEWLFNITHIGSDKYDIHLLDNTVKHTGYEGVLHKFGIFIHKRTSGRLDIKYWDCSVTSLQNNRYRTVCKGVIRSSIDISEDTVVYYQNSLVLKSRPSNYADNNKMVVFNKLDKNKAFIVFTYGNSLLSKSCETVNCFAPRFVDQMNDKLFAQIDSVVDFNFGGIKGGKSGYLLLLNINGRPMMCFTFEGEDISEEVRHRELLFF